MNNKSEKIYMQDWLSLHTYQQSSADDQWYLEFAQNLIPLLKKSSILQEFTFEEYKDLALLLTVYCEDAVSEGGGWMRFRNRIEELYQKKLPFYNIKKDEYFDSEINREDIQFVIWSFLSCPQDEIGDDYILMNPLDKELEQLSSSIFNLLDEAFEDAPVTEAESADWIMDMELLQRNAKAMPLITAEHCTSASAKKLLEFTKGYPLQFFASYDDLARFFVDILKWEDKEESLMPEMKPHKNFILYANSKGILLAPEAALYFKADQNPLYDADKAQEESYVLFCEQGSCPFDLLKYGISQGYLKEAALPFDKGHQLLQDNWDFITRWYLGEFYEGD